MGYKNVCVSCRIVKNLGTDYHNFHESNCTNCGENMIFIHHAFRAPKKTDDKAWKVVKYLIDNGFRFGHQMSEKNYVSYPETLEEAKEFVEKYKK